MKCHAKPPLMAAHSPVTDRAPTDSRGGGNAPLEPSRHPWEES